MKNLLLTGVLLASSMAAFAQSSPASGTAAATQSAAVASAPSPISLDEIKELSSKGVSTEIILKLLQNNPAIYNLNAREVSDLHTAKVKSEIIEYLLSTPRLYQTPPPAAAAAAAPATSQPASASVVYTPPLTPRTQTRVQTVYVPTYVAPRTSWSIGLGHDIHHEVEHYPVSHHPVVHFGGGGHGGGHHGGGHH